MSVINGIVKVSKEGVIKMYLNESISAEVVNLGAEGKYSDLKLTYGDNDVTLPVLLEGSSRDLVDAKDELIRELIMLSYDYKPTLEEYKNFTGTRLTFTCLGDNTSLEVHDGYDRVCKGYSDLLQLLGSKELASKAIDQYVSVMDILSSGADKSDYGKLVLSHNNW